MWRSNVYAPIRAGEGGDMVLRYRSAEQGGEPVRVHPHFGGVLSHLHLVAERRWKLTGAFKLGQALGCPRGRACRSRSPSDANRAPPVRGVAFFVGNAAEIFAEATAAGPVVCVLRDRGAVDDAVLRCCAAMDASRRAVVTRWADRP